MEENKEKETQEEKREKPLHLKILEETENLMKDILEKGIETNNLEYLSELVDIHKDIIEERKEIDNMNYGNYGGRRPGYDTYGRDEYGRGSYGEYGNYGEYGRENYGARGRDMKYRGYDHLDRMSNEYGRYMESRERYGANNEDTDKSFHYMVKALEDFVMVLKEEADTPQQKQKLMQALQNSMR